MSFGNSNRGSRSGGKGSAERKKAKKKRQEFHTHRQRSVEVDRGAGESTLEFNQLKARVSVSLSKLGQQKLSTEPGGYDFRSWTRSLTTLMNDFEAKVGSARLPPEYHRTLDELNGALFFSSDVSALDGEIASLKREAAELRLKEDQERRLDLQRLDEVLSEKDRISKELDDATVSDDSGRDEKSASFLTRLLGRGSRPRNAPKVDTAYLRAQLDRLESEAETLRSKVKSHADATAIPDGNAPPDPSQGRLLIEARVAKLVVEREQKLQLSSERESLTSELARIISKINVEGGPDHVAREVATASREPEELPEGASGK
jgi:hypothetical protein